MSELTDKNIGGINSRLSSGIAPMGLSIAANEELEIRRVIKFGFNDSVGTTFVPISMVGDYKTPVAATALELVSSNAGDAAAGAGAREVAVQGLDANWAHTEQLIIPNGTTAVAIPTSLLRVYRAYVTQSGTYSTFLPASGSHLGDITIQVSGGGAAWCSIADSGIKRGQSQIGAYTIEDGYIGYVCYAEITVDAGKPADLIFLQRPNADVVAAPYTGAVREVFSLTGVAGQVLKEPKTPYGPFVGPCDLCFVGKVATGTGAVSVEFEIIEKLAPAA